MLFHVVNDRHRRKHAMIFTTNKPTTAWGRVLHDDDLAQAIVDRILERGRLLTLDGPSLRTKHLGLDDTTSEASNQEGDNLARISGIARPEFLEPTPVEVFTQPSTIARGLGHDRSPGVSGGNYTGRVKRPGSVANRPRRALVPAAGTMSGSVQVQWHSCRIRVSWS